MDRTCNRAASQPACTLPGRCAFCAAVGTCAAIRRCPAQTSVCFITFPGNMTQSQPASACSAARTKQAMHYLSNVAQGIACRICCRLPSTPQFEVGCLCFLVRALPGGPFPCVEIAGWGAHLPLRSDHIPFPPTSHQNTADCSASARTPRRPDFLQQRMLQSQE